jgi:hypothetical protein
VFLCVMCGAEVFSPLVGTIGVVGAPEVSELLLQFVASKPMESHVHCFRLPGLDVVVYGA